VADYDEVIPPGGEGKVDVVIYGHKIQPGKFRKGYTIKTNDPEAGRIILHVTGTVLKTFDFSKKLSLSGFVDESLEMETVITTLIEDPVKITGCRLMKGSKDYEILNENLGIKFDEIKNSPGEKNGRKYRLKVWKKKNMPAGYYRGDILLTTDFERVKEKRVSVTLSITPDVEIQPRTIYLHDMIIPEGTTKDFSRLFRVVAARGDSLKILRVLPDNENISVNVKETQPGKAYECRIKVRPPSTVGRYDASLTVVTNYPGYEEMTVAITGSVRPVSRPKK
jgi:hypothetical protein